MLDDALLSINQVTVLPQWSLAECVKGLARQEVRGISVWREKLHETGVAEAARLIEDHGLSVSGLCFAGMITSVDEAEAARALDEVRRAIDEAAAIKAQCLIFVTGGVDPRARDLAATRGRALERVASLIPHARQAGVKIGLETLHPMLCGHRSVLSTLGIVNDWCDALDADDVIGIAIDAYAVWWDPDLETQIARAGKRICAFHINDWLADTRDLRLDRGMMGDGVIDIPAIRRMIQSAGYEGQIEVEIFSERNWWKRDPDEVVRVVKERFQTAV
jgi:sugar phosphate isomerase/epimerase